MGRHHLRLLAGLIAAIALLVAAAPASAAKQPKLKPATYPDMTTFQCRTDAIPIHPGQNLNDFTVTKTCPNAVKVSGPGDTSIFSAGSDAQGWVTRFKPSMVEIKADGSTVTPSVWDLHLHHVVWLKDGFGPTFASGEEKTIATMPQGYGIKVGATDDWGLNQMIHSLNASEGRSVYITWEIDWVPETETPRTDIINTRIQWLDVAGAPQVYPVFDAEREFDANGDGKYVFPDEVPVDPSEPGYEERENISNERSWVVPNSGATLVFGAGHLHPGGKRVDLRVARDGPDPGEVDGDTPNEIQRLFRSDAKYYEPAGAVSWDVALEATPREWRISLKPGDTVYINTTYNVKRASWYESMGILPLAWSRFPDPAARDPFDQRDEVKAMYKQGGVLTHGRLKENIDWKARKDLNLADPRKLPSGAEVSQAGIDIDGFIFENGGFSAIRGFPATEMRPAVVSPGERVTFTNLDALPGQPQTEQAWHSITSCRAPCNKGSGIGYPLANGPISFDSGQLGYGQGTSFGVTTQSNQYTTPALTESPTANKRGTTYTYFCRIHPYMRGSLRVK
jgi:plastocyanin